MSLSIHIFIPSTLSGWKYCMMHPRSFFSAWSSHKYLIEGIKGLEAATKYANDCASHAVVECNRLHDENNALRDKVAKLEAKLKEKGAH